MQHKAWYNYDRFDPSIPRKIEENFTVLKRRKQRQVRAGVRLLYLYERDRFAGNGKAYNMPQWVLEQYQGWMNDVDFAAPRFNLIKSRCDYLNSTLFQKQGTFAIKSENASFEEQRVASSRAAALDALMNTEIAKEQLSFVALLALISNFAACVTIVREGKLQFIPITLQNLYWDSKDVSLGSGPKSMHWVEYVDKDLLISYYEDQDAKALDIPKYTKKLEKLKELAPVRKTHEIDDCLDPLEYEDFKDGIVDCTERLRVVHSYRVATNPLKEDGRYICTVYGDHNQSQILIDKPFTRTTLPIVWFSPYKSTLGSIVGTGYAALLVETQRALDFSMARTQHRIEKLGWAKIGMPMGVNDQTMVDYLAEDITAVRMPGLKEPFQFQTDGLSQHDLVYMDKLIAWSSELYGVNQVIAAGGSDSGANASALSKYEDVDRQQDRMTDIYEQWRRFRLRVAEEALNAIEDEVRVNPNFATQYDDEDGDLIKYDWADKTLPNAKFTLSIEESGEKSRKVRIEQIMDGAKMGIFTPEQASAMAMQDPDVKRVTRLANAGWKAVERDLDDLINPRGNHEVTPTEDYDLPLTVSLAGQTILDAIAARAEPATIARLREYRRAAESLLQTKIAEQQAQQVAAAAATQASGDLTEMATDQQAQAMMANQGIM